MNVKKYEDILGTDEELIVKRLEKWAIELANKPYIYYGEEDETYTYKDINEMANNFAYNLMNQGVQKGDRISVFLRNPFISTIAMYGIWKAGAVFSPINFNYKGRLLSYQINDTKPKLVVTEKNMIPIINDVKSELAGISFLIHKPKVTDHDYKKELEYIQLDEVYQELVFEGFDEKVEQNPNVLLHYYDTANIIYTSGTTGPAKGVVQSYRWLHGYTHFFRSLDSQEDVLYNDLPMYHVGGAFEIVARAAFVGCTVALWDKFSPSEFWKRVQKSGSTFAILLDVMIPWLTKESPSQDDRNNTLKNVYMQPLPDYYQEVAERFGFDFVCAGYGQTEAGNTFSAIFDIFGEEEGTPKKFYKGYTKEQFKHIAEQLDIHMIEKGTKVEKGFMGAPNTFITATILNEQDEECEIGEVGEIGFRSHYPYTMLQEYYNRNRETLDVFRNLWFHSGDMGYRDKWGNFHFVDRMKDIIRHKGENISSFQIEDILHQHELVNLCAAFPIPAEEGSEDDIVVYVIATEEGLTEKALFDWTKREMPKFMRPKYIRIVNEIPKTPTNKIEKYKLKEQILLEFSS